MRFAEVVARPGVKETVVLRSPIGLLAPHGSSMEDGTEHIAAIVAERTGSSVYTVTYPGTWEDCRALHVSGVHIEPDETPALAAFTSHCKVVFAIHGFTRDGLREAALVGGGNVALADRLASELRQRLPEPGVVLDGDDVPPSLRGRNPLNLTNRFPEQGVQLELAVRLRAAYPSRIFWGGSTPNENIFSGAVVAALCHVIESVREDFA